MTPTPLDFAAIRSRCPNAFAALIGWFCDGKHFQLGVPTADSPDEASAGWGPSVSAGVGVLEVGDFRDQYTLNVRDLFDFFDEQGVYMSVQLLLWQEDISTFAWLIRWHSNIHIDQSQYPTRAAAEAAAFGAAFAKLEEILGKEEEI